MVVEAMDIALTLLVVAFALVGFVVEWVPVDITAVATMVALIVLKQVSPEEGISGFSNSATITVMAMFILSAGIARTGAIRSLTRLLTHWGGRRAPRQIFTMGILVGPISALINNSAVVPMFVPIIEGWSSRLKISVSKLLIPLSYASILGGTITTIGTSTNVLASGISEQLGYEEFSLFFFTKMGLITFGVGILYLSLIAPHLLPDRRSPLDDIANLSDAGELYTSEVLLHEGASEIGQPICKCGLKSKFNIEILELVRNGRHLTQVAIGTRFQPPARQRVNLAQTVDDGRGGVRTLTQQRVAQQEVLATQNALDHKVLQENDILIVRGTLEQLLQLQEEQGLDLLPHTKFGQEGPAMPSSTEAERVAEVLVLDNTSFIGSTLKDLNFRERYNSTVLALRRGQDKLSERIDRVKLRIGDVLLVRATPSHLASLQLENNLIVLQEMDVTEPRSEKALIAIGISALVVGLSAMNIMPIMVSALLGAVLMVVTGCLEPAEIYTAVRWNIIFLLAGLIPLGIAMEKSHTTLLIAKGMAAISNHLPGYWILVVFYLVTVLLTEVLSNSASVVLMVPVAIRAAETLQMNPMAFILVVTFAASASFMTPIGYQTNTMVYTTGGYKFLDFTRVGAPLSLMLSLLTPFLIVHFYGL
ncbi:MAG: SLC13 family permease [Synechococcus sp.]